MKNHDLMAEDVLPSGGESNRGHLNTVDQESHRGLMATEREDSNAGSDHRFSKRTAESKVMPYAEDGKDPSYAFDDKKISKLSPSN